MWWNKKRADANARTFDVIRSRRKSLAIEIQGNGDILVRAPLEISDRGILRFVRDHEDWIEKKLRELKRRQSDLEESEQGQGEKSAYSEEELKELTKRARKILREKTDHYARQMGAEVNRIAIRRQRSRWGSCSSKGNLNFNCLLMLCPDQVQDYVVVHELAHRFEMNHSAAFWQIVENYCPDYRGSRAWLKEHGGQLIARLPEKERRLR